MSELWSVRVLSSRKDEVKLRVITAHPDAGKPPRTKKFAVLLLADLNRQVADGGGGSEDWSDEDEVRRTGKKAVRDVKAEDVHEAPAGDEEIMKLIHARLDEQGIGPDDERREEKAEAAYEAWWQDPDNPPAVTLVLSVADPAWAKKLEAGSEFASAVYV